MSQGGSPSQIGAVSVGIGLDPSKLKSDLKQAEAETKAAAAQMGRDAKVGFAGGPSALFPGHNLPPSVGGGAGASAVVAEIDKIAPATDKATAAVQKFESSSAFAFSRALGFITRVTGAIGAMIAAAYGAAKAISAIAESATAAETETNKFLASIGSGVGEGATARLEKIKDEIDKYQAEIANKNGSVFQLVKDQFTGRTDSSLQDRVQNLVKALNAGSAQVKQQRDLQRKSESQLDKLNAQETQNEIEAAKRDAAMQSNREIEREEDRLHDGRIENAKQIKGHNEDLVGGPAAALTRATNEQLQQLHLMSRYGDAFEKMLAAAATKALIEGSALAMKKIQDQLRNAILDAFNSALKASDAGSGNVPSLLSGMSVKMDAIRMTIPRDY